MFVTIENKKLTFYGRPTTQAVMDMGPVLLQISCKQSKTNIQAVADLFWELDVLEVDCSSDLGHPAACGVHPRFDGTALVNKAFLKALTKPCKKPKPLRPISKKILGE